MPTPMVDEIELTAVQWIREETEQGFVRHEVAGLEGTLYERLGRRSHRVLLAGLLVSASAGDDLRVLQEKASAGAEVTFTADITTALSVEKMVIESFAAEQEVGPATQFSYTIVLAESPPLPPPAEVAAFGGLGDFGVGDIGFDPDALGGVLEDVSGQASAITGALDTALGAIDQLEGLAALGDLASLDNPMRPLTDKLGELAELGPPVGEIVQGLRDLIGGG